MTSRVSEIFASPLVSFLCFGSVAFAILAWCLRRPAPVIALDQEGGPTDRYIRGLVVRALLGLVAVGVGAYAVLTDHLAQSLPLFATGFGLWLWLVQGNAKLRYTHPTLRKVVGVANAALTASLLGGVLIVGNLLAFKYGGNPIDLTRERSFSLSAMTTNLLRTLDRPVTMTVFHGRSVRSVRQLERVMQLLELYRQANPKLVKLSSLDMFGEPDRFESLAKQVPDVSVNPDGGVVVEYGEGEGASRIVVRNSDLFRLPGGPGSSPDRYTTEFNGEDAITSALARLIEGKRPLIAFTTGHGEPSINNTDLRQAGLGLWRARLDGIGSNVVEVDLGREAISLENSLMVIVGPRSPFTTEEISKLRAYLRSGKPLLVLIDGESKTGLQDLLKEARIAVGQGVVVDPSSNYNNQIRLAVAPLGVAARHPIVTPLANRRVIFPNAGPLTILPPEPGAQTSGNLRPAPFLFTGPQSWAESHPDRSPIERSSQEDILGPVLVGVAVETMPARPDATPTPRMVVFSSRHLGENPLLEIVPTNLDLLMNSVTWLRNRPDLLGISPKTHVALTLSVNPRLRARLVVVPTIMAVVVILGLGVSTYIARRN